MKAGLDRSETPLGIDSCLLQWEEQVGRSSSLYFVCLNYHYVSSLNSSQFSCRAFVW